VLEQPTAVAAGNPVTTSGASWWHADPDTASKRRENPCPLQFRARVRKTAGPRGSRGAAWLPGQRGNTIPAAAVTWRTRS
jgi:hypothetical protein